MKCNFSSRWIIFINNNIERQLCLFSSECYLYSAYLWFYKTNNVNLAVKMNFFNLVETEYLSNAMTVTGRITVMCVSERLQSWWTALSSQDFFFFPRKELRLKNIIFDVLYVFVIKQDLERINANLSSLECFWNPC